MHSYIQTNTHSQKNRPDQIVIVENVFLLHKLTPDQLKHNLNRVN